MSRGSQAIQAAKRTSDIIPLCHPLRLTGVDVDLRVANNAVYIMATVRAFDRSGVEMEALAAVTAAALTIYDMCKAIDRGMVISRDPARREARRQVRDLAAPRPARVRAASGAPALGAGRSASACSARVVVRPRGRVGAPAIARRAIIGGTATTVGQYPTVVALVDRQQPVHRDAGHAELGADRRRTASIPTVLNLASQDAGDRERCGSTSTRSTSSTTPARW